LKQQLTQNQQLLEKLTKEAAILAEAIKQKDMEVKDQEAKVKDLTERLKNLEGKDFILIIRHYAYFIVEQMKQVEADLQTAINAEKQTVAELEKAKQAVVAAENEVRSSHLPNSTIFTIFNSLNKRSKRIILSLLKPR
jgi:ABC-type Zn2+ transport system substrate-binding protein/surface adhesin